MQFKPPLERATLVRRYKRFLADVILEDGREITAHVANPGAMTGLADPGQSIWVQPATNPKRKLKYSWVLVDHGDGYTGVDTSLPNRIIKHALETRLIAPLGSYEQILPEQKYGEGSRIDFLLKGTAIPDTYVEVKSVTLSRTKGIAEFPDAVTKRGAKHLDELSRMATLGHRAVMLYLIQRTDCDIFRPAADIDPAYSRAFQHALGNGVEALAYGADLSPEAARLGTPIDILGPNGS